MTSKIKMVINKLTSSAKLTKKAQGIAAYGIRMIKGSMNISFILKDNSVFFVNLVLVCEEGRAKEIDETVFKGTCQ